MPDSGDIEERAAWWVARRTDGRANPADTQAFEAWMDAAIEHRVAYLRLAAAWQRLDRLSGLPIDARIAHDGEDGASLGMGRAPASLGAPGDWWRASGRMKATFATFATFALLAVVLPLAWRAPQITTVAAVRGGHVTQRLADGSRVELNTSSRLRARLDGSRREVWLDEGEAYFEVAHDAAHPFVVHFGDRTVTVLGTRFSVRRPESSETNASVAVAEGRVRVSTPGQADVLLTLGDVASARGGARPSVNHSVDAVADRLAWRQGMLVFHDAPLGEVVAEFNRYNLRPLVVGDPDVAQIRLGGRFAAMDVDAFAQVMSEDFHLNVRATPAEVVISRR